MTIASDMARCKGLRCPSANNCERHTRATGVVAAFHNRREAGASACDAYRPVKLVSTFAATEAVKSEGVEP